MKPRSVKALLFAHEYPMGKLRVKQPFPTYSLDQIDPFILLHHANMKFHEDADLVNEGVGPHPHRGFSPVTFIFKGGVHHRDSMGNNSVIYEGGTQWMNAGRGVIHSERPPVDLHEKGGNQEIIQLWVNTPASMKMNTPEYFPLSAENTPNKLLEDGISRINIIAGELFGIKGPVKTPSPVNASTLFMKAGASIEIPVPENHNAFVYILDGKLNIKEFGEAEKHHAVYFSMDGECLSFKATEDTKALVMTGLPLNEPIATHGPFVMNNETQLLEAMRDYQMGKMGVLIEE